MKFRVFGIVIKHSLWCKVQPKPKQSNPLGPNRILGEQKPSPFPKARKGICFRTGCPSSHHLLISQNITTWSNSQVGRIKEMITKDNLSWCSNKFSPPVARLKRIWITIKRMCMLVLELKGLKIVFSRTVFRLISKLYSALLHYLCFISTLTGLRPNHIFRL